MHTATVATPTIRHGVIVSGQGQPVLLLHASISSKLQWTALTKRLKPRFRVVAMDLHGYGDNPLPTHPERFSITDQLELVRSQLATTVADGQRLHLVGHSFGGLVALQFALHHPERVASLTLYEPPLLGLFGHNDLAACAIRHAGRMMVALLRQGRSVEAAEVMVDFWDEPGAFARLPPTAQASAVAGTSQAALDFERIADQPLCIEPLRDLQVPTLLMGGTRSPAGARNCLTLLAATLPKSRLTWLSANHMAPITAPELVNPLIEDFLVAQPGGHAALWRIV